ncbi:hypothetical protein PYW08_014525 [Mythimna loreyi]|uniref:Uncharacterized protein n=1 Tax=Mythimna loreyi TaxID=667449 RepID=A0ACC2R4C2_9NEOP|nr:hypothetical protein PYW08_014525 [Mythimna loreyi]
MKLILLLCYLIFICAAFVSKKDSKKNKLTDGMEFDKISRSSLLKILAAFEDNLHKKLKRKNLKPVFTARFANNRFTKRYIYPNVFEAPKGKIHPYEQ